MSVLIQATEIVRNQNDLLAKIAETKLAGKALDKALQTVLVSAACHLHQHGNIAIADKVLDCLPQGIRTNAAKAFMIEFAPVNWNEKKKAFVFASTKRIEGFEETETFTRMLETQWVDFRPEPPFKPFDLKAQLESLIKRAETKAEEGDDRNLVSREEIDSAKALLSQLEAQRNAKAAQVAAETVAAATAE